MLLNCFDDKNCLSGKLADLITKAAKIIIFQELGDETAENYIEISVTMVSKEEIREINREYRSIDKCTDVLSFPQYNNAYEIADGISCIKLNEEMAGQMLMLGDVVLCYDVAIEQAEEYGNSIEREFVYLFVHSVLHLFGYDHMKDDDRRGMRAREESVMESLGLKRR